MRNQELSRQLQRLNGLFGRTAAASGGDIEIQAHWARYLCVLCAGFIENAFEEIYAEFVKGAASEPVARFTIRSLEKTNNPKTLKFIDTSRAFKEAWGDELEVFVDQNGRRDAIDSIMNNRHQIAHGKSSGISVARLEEWFEKSLEVIDFIENQVKR
jgi:hypothetical protein